jgi:AcrR family transcriptional regulator
MGRKRDPKRRAELLAGFVDYILDNGLGDLSLRPAAAALGTSPQILLYHFGSKEELISEAVAAARGRAVGMLVREIGRSRAGAPPSETLWRIWRWFTARRRAPFMRLFFEVFGLALQHPDRFQEFLGSTSQFLAMVEEGFAGMGFPRERSRALGTLYLDSLRGILLDYLLTGDRARIDTAVALVAQHLERDLHGNFI